MPGPSHETLMRRSWALSVFLAYAETGAITHVARQLTDEQTQHLLEVVEGYHADIAERNAAVAADPTLKARRKAADAARWLSPTYRERARLYAKAWRADPKHKDWLRAYDAARRQFPRPIGAPPEPSRPNKNRTK